MSRAPEGVGPCGGPPVLCHPTVVKKENRPLAWFMWESTTGDKCPKRVARRRKERANAHVCVLSHSPVWEGGWSMIGPWRGRRLRRRVLPDSAGDVGETAGQVAIERTFESSVAGS